MNLAHSAGYTSYVQGNGAGNNLLFCLWLFLLQEGENEVSQAILDDRTKRAEAWHRDAAARVRYTIPAQPITCATFAQDVIEGRAQVSQAHEHKHQPLIFGPASLVGGNPTSERERMAAQVFQPSYRYICMPLVNGNLSR